MPARHSPRSLAMVVGAKHLDAGMQARYNALPRVSCERTMSQAASQYGAFARDVAEHGRVWTVRDDGGFPAPKTTDGHRAMPFWSSLSRVERIIDTVPAYAGFEPFEITWDIFRDNWLPGLERDGLRVGVNWSGPRALGYDLAPEDVRARIDYELTKRNATGNG